MRTYVEITFMEISYGDVDYPDGYLVNYLDSDKLNDWYWGTLLLAVF